jgi:hypothetical protein
MFHLVLRAHPNVRVVMLLLLALFQAAGWQLAWQAARGDARAAAQQAVARRDTPFETLRLGRGQLDALRIEPHEIVLHGRLYDIRREMALPGDSVEVELYHDVREEKLLHRLNDLLAPTDAAASGLPDARHWLLQWLAMPGEVPPSGPVVAAHGADEVWVAAVLHPRLPAAQFAPGSPSPPPWG